MSRLDSFLRRMTAQRDLLEMAVPLIADVPGPIVDLGLGAGRTYDHMQVLFPDRAVFAFDRSVEVAVGVFSGADRLVIGDIRDTLALSLPRLGAPAALVHNDLGSSDDVDNAAIAAWLVPQLARIVAPRAVVVTSFAMDLPGAEAIALPPTVRQRRYHLYRMSAQDGGARTSCCTAL